VQAKHLKIFSTEIIFQENDFSLKHFSPKQTGPKYAGVNYRKCILKCGPHQNILLKIVLIFMSHQKHKTLAQIHFQMGRVRHPSLNHLLPIFIQPSFKSNGGFENEMGK
jgi:hypothetical protein